MLALPLWAMDRLRLVLLRAFSPMIAPFIVNREKRVMMMGVTAITLAGVTAIGCPLYVLALGPVLIGIPHVAAGVRYLLIQPRLHRQTYAVPAAISVGCLTYVCGGRSGLGIALMAACGAAVTLKTHAKKTIILTAIALPIIIWALMLPALADAIFIQLHNAIAVVIWWIWRPRQHPYHRWLLGGMLACTALIVMGATDGFIPNGLAWSAPANAINTPHLAHILVPEANPNQIQRWGSRLIVLYAFGQSIHYAVWLRLLPEEDRQRSTPRSFTASWHAWRNIMGAWHAYGWLVLSLGIVISAIINLSKTRWVYFQVFAWHGYVELVALAVMYVQGRSLRVSN